MHNSPIRGSSQETAAPTPIRRSLQTTGWPGKIVNPTASVIRRRLKRGRLPTLSPAWQALSRSCNLKPATVPNRDRRAQAECAAGGGLLQND